MPQYLVELWHAPHASPLSNAAVKQKAIDTHAALPVLMEAKGIRQTASYHLDPEHRAILIFEGPSVESVRDLLYESGFMHWCDGRVYPTTPLSELRKWSVGQSTIH